jgi:hypothetical protein
MSVRKNEMAATGDDAKRVLEERVTEVHGDMAQMQYSG